MAHRGGRNKKRNGTNPYCRGFGLNYWGTQDYNTRLYNYYRNIMLQMVTNRYKWVNLPKTCNERYLNLTLALEGVATIAFPEKLRGTFFSTKAVLDSQPNVYDEYPRWRSIGNKGWNFEVTPKNGVLVFDNTTRFPIMESIDLYATELVHIRMTKNMNRFHQQIPWILTGPQEKVYDMQQIVKQVSGGELAILGTDALSSMKPETLSTGVPYIGEQLAADEQSVWNRVYTMIGIENTPFKSERQTEDEVRAQKSPAQIVRMATLSSLRDACDRLNNRFGDYLDGEIGVVWNQDNFSENWNLMHNDLAFIKTVNE